MCKALWATHRIIKPYPFLQEAYNLVKEDTIFFIFIFCLFAFSRAAPAAYGSSQARGPIGAVATGLCHSHSNTGSEPSLQPTPQLTATLNPQPTE